MLPPGNTFSVVRYMEAVLAGSASDKVVVDRNALRVIVRLAKQHRRYSADKRTFHRFAPAEEDLSGAQRSELSRSAQDEPFPTPTPTDGSEG